MNNLYSLSTIAQKLKRFIRFYSYWKLVNVKDYGDSIAIAL